MSKSLSSVAVRGGSIYMALPEDIAAKTENNSRKYSDHDLDQIIAEFLDPAIGQLQPVGVIQGKEGPIIAWGYKRHAAAVAINENSLYKGRAHLNGEPFRLSCVSVKAATEEPEANIFVKSVVENLSRKNTTPIDDAHNIDRLITEFGWDRKRVSALYHGKSDAWITNTLALLRLDPKDQKRVHSGDLAVSAAYELAKSIVDADPETVAEVTGAVQTAEAEKGERLTREEVKEVSRKARRSADSKADAKAAKEAAKAAKAGEAAPAPKPKKKKRGRPQSESTGRTMKQVKAFFVGLSEFENEELDADGTTAQLGKQFLKFIDGGLSDNGLRRIIMRYGALIE